MVRLACLPLALAYPQYPGRRVESLTGAAPSCFGCVWAVFWGLLTTLEVQEDAERPPVPCERGWSTGRGRLGLRVSGGCGSRARPLVAGGAVPARSSGDPGGWKAVGVARGVADSSRAAGSGAAPVTTSTSRAAVAVRARRTAAAAAMRLLGCFEGPCGSV